MKNNQNFGGKKKQQNQQHRLSWRISFLLLIIFTDVVISSEPIYFNFVLKNLSYWIPVIVWDNGKPGSLINTVV